MTVHSSVVVQIQHNTLLPVMFGRQAVSRPAPLCRLYSWPAANSVV